ncbi:unnamed protein product [Rotaria socialis]|uniref:Gamma-glutamylcyclotransferase AIG2-like domain-containing protein n=2 Tax=Rotaria socialis TaxID=392032 RepID=A0A820HD31_9BILA|nr:unnamed protein product [Rotaria socialis]CAF3421376.1 unnamed protein product [Rotaria socialis]CAF4293022.1 unnamed protein product [Rotaria socialis]CAF4575607.1 unnamed protein product [Rotaria socialis]
MSSNIQNSTDVQLLATYGTLRDDDNSGAPWTHNFIKDISGATSGTVAGYQLFDNASLNYPFAVFTGNPKDTIVVRLLSWQSKEEFQKKIHEGDILEGDEYERKVVEVLSENKTKFAYIYVSKSKSLDADWKIIPSGDWLRRNPK